MNMCVHVCVRGDWLFPCVRICIRMMHTFLICVSEDMSGAFSHFHCLQFSVNTLAGHGYSMFLVSFCMQLYVCSKETASSYHSCNLNSTFLFSNRASSCEKVYTCSDKLACSTKFLGFSHQKYWLQAYLSSRFVVGCNFGNPFVQVVWASLGVFYGFSLYLTHPINIRGCHY